MTSRSMHGNPVLPIMIKNAISRLKTDGAMWSEKTELVDPGGESSPLPLPLTIWVLPHIAPSVLSHDPSDHTDHADDVEPNIVGD
jgi:hypothetical protein